MSPTTAQHVADDLGERLDARRDVIFDGGPCAVGVESTIVDTTVAPAQILRPGAIGADDIGTLLDGVGQIGPTTGPARASGMLHSHYAPSCEVRVVESRDDAVALAAGTIGGRILDRTDDVARTPETSTPSSAAPMPTGSARSSASSPNRAGSERQYAIDSRRLRHPDRADRSAAPGSQIVNRDRVPDHGIGS